VARPIDFSSLTGTERIVLGAGLGLAVNGFIPWWYRVATTDAVVSYNAGLSGWGIVAVPAGFVAMVVVGVRAAIWPEPAPKQDGAVYALLGVIALVALIVELTSTEAEWVGAYVAVFLAAVLTFAGVRRRLERRVGWT